MCELFALDTKEPVEAGEYLRDFFSHSLNHPNGWGLAQPSEYGCNLEREPIMASKSHYLKARLACSIPSSILLAHIRKATIGNEEYNNCHPFVGMDRSGRQWTFMHNGTIFQLEGLDQYLYVQKGRTDSERLFLMFLDRMNEAIRKNGELTEEQRFAVVEAMILEAAPGNKLNLILYDGEILYVHMNKKGTLHTLELENGRLFSTNPLVKSTVVSKWKPLPMMQLLAYKDGTLIREGTVHEHEYIYEPERYEHIYYAFSEL